MNKSEEKRCTITKQDNDAEQENKKTMNSKQNKQTKIYTYTGEYNDMNIFLQTFKSKYIAIASRSGPVGRKTAWDLINNKNYTRSTMESTLRNSMLVTMAATSDMSL